MTDEGKAPLDVYTVVERGGKSYWVRIGVAFINRDRSLNVRLDALPVTGELQIRKRTPRDEHRG